MTRAKLIAAAIAAVLVIIVIAQNTEPVDTRLLLVTITMPRAILLAVTFGGGLAVGLILATALLRRRQKTTAKVAPRKV
jgi:uncharacterized integral membrane protein